MICSPCFTVVVFLLLLLLHPHGLNLFPPAAHCNAAALSAVPSLSSAAMHLGISQDMESDPDDEVKQSLHHLRIAASLSVS